MKLSNLEKTRYPIIYMTIGFLFSSIIFAYGKRNLGLVLGVTALFLAVIAFRESFEFAFIMMLVLGIGVVVNYNFYRLNLNELEEVRVTRVYGDFGFGEIKGRRVKLIGPIKEVVEGVEIVCSGDFIRNEDYEKGEIGEFKIKKFQLKKQGVFTRLAEFKEMVRVKIRENLGVRKEALITSIIFGRNNDLDIEDKADMKSLGVVHAMSVSGLHIALIFLVFKKIFGVKMAIGMTFFYVLITGLSFSSLRAFIMMTLLNMSILVKRNNNSIASLSCSALILFFWKPYLIFDIGFQLSYGATLGIILFNGELNQKLYKIPGILRGTISISLAAQILVFPLLIIYFNSFAPLFILGNIILIPIINLILFIGIATVMTIYFDGIFKFFNYILLKLVEILDFLVRSLSYIDIEEIYLGEVVGYFYVFTLVCLYLYKRKVEIAKYLPIPYMLVLMIRVYSPIPTINYLDRGTLLISFRGEKAIMTSNKNIDRNEIVKKTGGKIIDGNNLNIGEFAKIKEKGKDFILEIEREKYYLNLGSEKKAGEYDIINFKDGKVKKLLILKDKAVVME